MAGGMFAKASCFRYFPYTNLLTRHVMTGIGAYLYLVWGIWLRHCLNKRQEEYHLWWPHFWNFPEILRTSSLGKTENGTAKKSN